MRSLLVALLAVMATPSVALGENGRTDGDYLKALIDRAKEFGADTAEAGHECLGQLHFRGSGSDHCKKFRAQSDSAQDMYFRMKTALAEHPDPNAWIYYQEGLSEAEYNYHWIRQSESALIDMGVYDPRLH